MKNRVKGLLALCLAMCMVLAMTTVAFADGTTYYYNSTSLNNWVVLQSGDTVSASCGMFFVVDESQNYMANVNTATNGATGSASSSKEQNSNDRPYFQDGNTFDVSKLDSNYTYSVKKVTVPEGKEIYIFYDGAPVQTCTSALMLKAVPKTYTVKYDTDGGSTISDKTGLAWDGKVLDGITDPTKANCKFVRWEYNSNPVTPNAKYSDLVTDNTTASITLTAVWEVLPDDETPTTPTPTHQHTRRQPATTTVETPSTTVASPKTFDAGVAVYGVMAALSLTGTAAIIGKKKKF